MVGESYDRKEDEFYREDRKYMRERIFSLNRGPLIFVGAIILLTSIYFVADYYKGKEDNSLNKETQLKNNFLENRIEEHPFYWTRSNDPIIKKIYKPCF